ncbi:hypothetical protein PF008_g28876 [Phytophthora fragariae]|uniref:Uncharacterized protein n=1 Tax=Phytophthora fragariae TaxID=53985 RepID=A0A6G0QAV4_9STRA|nr:hypothetical protein PF008_g28876 [Phytophthora fragariae]
MDGRLKTVGRIVLVLLNFFFISSQLFPGPGFLCDPMSNKQNNPCYCLSNHISDPSL